MSLRSGQMASSPQSTLARWLANRDTLPVSIRAVTRFYARTGNFDLTALRLQGWVEDTMEAFISEAFSAVERRLAEELSYTDITLEYDTKLTQPVELTLGYLYRQALSQCDEPINPVTETVGTSPLRSLLSRTSTARRDRLREQAADTFAFVERAEQMARLCTEALIDGDMRDAINDDEYEDFETNKDLSPAERAQVAKIAQACLQDRVTDQLASFPDTVADQYQRAVDRSNSHQATDEHFRELMARAIETDDQTAIERIKSEYKYASYEDPPSVLTAEEQAWPYSKTQYERVGVIYAGMIEMFRAADLPIAESFKRAVVLSIIGAQIWLDDVDDFTADRAAQQLTPVTAEYLLADSDAQAYTTVRSIASQYFDQAITEAMQSQSALTGIATEYIYLSGTPQHLPGHAAVQS